VRHKLYRRIRKQIPECRTRMTTPPWFVMLACLGALYVAAVGSRLLAFLALCLCRPKDLCRSYGEWAIVTGPTSGLGRTMALELARRGLNLVLLDLDAANLRETADTIKSSHDVKTKTVVFDLSLVGTAKGDDNIMSIILLAIYIWSLEILLSSAGDEAMRQLREAIHGLDVGLLVNNAAVARPGAVYFHEADIESFVRMLRVNSWALTEVTAAVLPGIVERGRGAVVNVGSGSTLAVPSFPLYTVYSSTKRSVTNVVTPYTFLLFFSIPLYFLIGLIKAPKLMTMHMDELISWDYILCYDILIDMIKLPKSIKTDCKKHEHLSWYRSREHTNMFLVTGGIQVISLMIVILIVD
jgi:short-subunit dehydrogenase